MGLATRAAGDGAGVGYRVGKQCQRRDHRGQQQRSKFELHPRHLLSDR